VEKLHAKKTIGKAKATKKNDVLPVSLLNKKLKIMTEGTVKVITLLLISMSNNYANVLAITGVNLHFPYVLLANICFKFWLRNMQDGHERSHCNCLLLDLLFSACWCWNPI